MDEEELDAAWKVIVKGAIDHVHEKYKILPDGVTEKYPYAEWKDKLKDDPELLGMDLMIWFTLERAERTNGKTPLEEFAETKAKDKEILDMVKSVRHVVKSEFTVVQAIGTDKLRLKSKEGKIYDTRMGGRNRDYVKGAVIAARLYCWGDEYRFSCIPLVISSPSWDKKSNAPVHYYLIGLLIGPLGTILVWLIYRSLVHRKLLERDYNNILILTFVLDILGVILTIA